MVAGVIIPILILFAIIAFFLYKSIYMIRQAEGIVIERLGKYHRVLTSGLNFIVPYFDQPRAFTWRRTFIDVNGKVRSENTSHIRIDLRESVFNFTRQDVYTKDTILLDVNSLMFYRIIDIKKAVYEVDDLQGAISNVAQTQIKEVFGNMTFTEAMTSQEKINDYMVKTFAEKFSRWGVQVERMEMLDMTPKSGTSIAAAMKRQMIAERERRAEFIKAEGKKAAMRLESEGTKMEKYNLGIAEQESTRKRSEGEAGAKVEIARAESQSLATVATAITNDGAKQTEYMIAQRYLDLFRGMIHTVQTKTLYLPFEASGLSGLVGSLASVYGRKSDAGNGGNAGAAAMKKEKSRRGFAGLN